MFTINNCQFQNHLYTSIPYSPYSLYTLNNTESQKTEIDYQTN